MRGFAESTIDLRHHINSMRPANLDTPAEPAPPTEPDPHHRLSRNQVRWAFICTGIAGILIGALGTLAALDVRKGPTTIPETLQGLGRTAVAFLGVAAFILLSTRSAVRVIVQRLDRNHAQAEANAAAMRRMTTQQVGLASAHRQLAQCFLALADDRPAGVPRIGLDSEAVNAARIIARRLLETEGN